MSEARYYYPEVFVEGVESDLYIVETKNGEYVLTKNRDVFNHSRFFGHIIYENVLEYIDLLNATISRGIIVIKEFGKNVMEGLLAEKNTRVCIVEIQGHRPIVFVNEGDEINEHDELAYTISRKGVIRSIKSPCSGVILLVVNITWEKPEKYILVVVNRDEYRSITIGESEGNRV